MAKVSPDENARRLAAWNAWKEVCWVHGLGKPRGGDLPVVGTSDDEDLLSRSIRNAFRRKLEPIMLHLEDVEGGSALSGFDFAEEFDNALIEYETVNRPDRRFLDGENGCLRKKKAWKDDVWMAVAASKDPPLKVILGKLLGRKGVINEIVEDWLLRNFSCDKHNVKGKDVIVFDRYADAKERGIEKASAAGRADGLDPTEASVIEVISPGSADADACGEQEDGNDMAEKEDILVPQSWLDELERAFPPRLCCLIAAHINGIKVYAEKEILSALGIGKSKAASELNKSRQCLSLVDVELRSWIMNDSAGTKFFREWIESRCELEKAGRLILSRIEDMKDDQK